MWTGKVNQLKTSSKSRLIISIRCQFGSREVDFRLRLHSEDFPLLVICISSSLRVGEFAFPPKPSECNRKHEVKTLGM
jgi:hypothetical protein